MKQVPDDHSIYDEGASVTVSPPRPDPEGVAPEAKETTSGASQGVGRVAMNSTAARLLAALSEARKDGEQVSGDDVSDLVELEAGEEVEWAASTFKDSQLINLFVCRGPAGPETVLASVHGDRGVIDWVDGPWGSLSAAKASFGKVPEGWSNL